jgi:hypothetical protein
MEKMKGLKTDAVINLPIGSSFYVKLKELLVFLAEDKTDEQIKDFEIAINEKKEITQEWMAHLFTVVLLIRAIEDKAEENDLLEDVDISQSDS